MERYTCPRTLLSKIETALAAEGYIAEPLLQRAVGGSRVTIMTRGTDVIALHEDMARDMADINVYHNGEAVGLSALESLPRLFFSTDPARKS